MKYSLDINIIPGNQGTLDLIRVALPLQSDVGIWPDEYSLNQGLTMESGIPVLSGCIRFDEGVDRDAALQSVIGVAEIFLQCEVGSYIRLHTCFHDVIPAKACVEETIYEVVA